MCAKLINALITTFFLEIVLVWCMDPFSVAGPYSLVCLYGDRQAGFPPARVYMLFLGRDIVLLNMIGAPSQYKKVPVEKKHNLQTGGSH